MLERPLSAAQEMKRVSLRAAQITRIRAGRGKGEDYGWRVLHSGRDLLHTELHADVSVKMTSPSVTLRSFSAEGEGDRPVSQAVSVLTNCPPNTAVYRPNQANLDSVLSERPGLHLYSLDD